MRLLSGLRSSQAIHVAASLGIPDLLADGPRQSGDLAREAGADPDALYRLLRALAAIGVLAEDDERGFALAGSFFDAVPLGGDAYILKSIVHDWEDEQFAQTVPTAAGLTVIEAIGSEP
jgi:Dimerisation domain/O-methyltransferase domain